MAERFARGGRLYAFGNGPYATDAAHVSVEFVHPVIVGKRALPALDASAAPDAFVDDAGRAGRHGDRPSARPRATRAPSAALRAARRKGAFTLAWPGATTAIAPTPTTRWPRRPTTRTCTKKPSSCSATRCTRACTCSSSTARDLGDDVGASAFLYPYLGSAQARRGRRSSTTSRPRSWPRCATANGCASRSPTSKPSAIAAAVEAIGARLAAGGRLLIFGNGGSATDATDFALGLRRARRPACAPLPAISLAAEPAVLTALANDVGTELTFLRQIVAQSRPGDVAFALLDQRRLEERRRRARGSARGAAC